ncbi:MAG: hypothetical protein M1153_00490 [Patescibacteria group bacterium]|nr:hypothetical protein [Patescibacteria group bacterium]
MKKTRRIASEAREQILRRIKEKRVSAEQAAINARGAYKKLENIGILPRLPMN